MKNLLIVFLFTLLPLLASAADFAVEVRNGIPQFTKDGKPFSGWIYAGQFNHIVEKQFNYKAKAMIGAKLGSEIAGVKIINFSLYPENYWSNPNEPAEDRYKRADKIISEILANVPDAYIIPRIQVRPPQWWIDANPDHVLCNYDGTEAKTLWRKDGDIMSDYFYETAVKEVIDVIRHLEKRFPNNMAGYQPAGQATGEWMNWGGHSATFLYGSQDSKRGFRKFLRKKYKDEAALRKAWNEPAVTFENATIPTPEEFKGDAVHPLREPAKDQAVIDYIECYNTRMADFVLGLSKAIRNEVGKKRLIGSFFGYFFETAAIPYGFGWIGHAQLRRILESPDIDYLAAPYSYKDRGLYDHGSTMSVADSIILSGKIWLNEDDTCTDLCKKFTGPGGEDKAKTEAETIMFLKRNLSFNLQRNSATWWLDLMGGGWYNNPAYWEMMKRFRQVEEKQLNDPQPYNPPIAFVVDGIAHSYLISGFPKTRRIEHEINAFLNAKGPIQVTSGASLHYHRKRYSSTGLEYGQYMLDDVLAGKVNSKLDVFFGLYALSKEQRSQLANLRQQKSCLWGYGAGWIDLETGKGSLKAVEETTGFKVSHAGENATQQVFSTPEARKKYALPEKFGANIRVEPLLTPKLQKGDEIIANYANGKPAIVIRKGKTMQIFCGVSEIPRSLYAAIGKKLNIKPKITPYAHTYNNKHFFTVYPLKDAKYTINHGFPNGAVELFSGKKLGDGPVLEIELKKFEVIVLTPANQ